MKKAHSGTIARKEEPKAHDRCPEERDEFHVLHPGDDWVHKDPPAPGQPTTNGTYKGYEGFIPDCRGYVASRRGVEILSERKPP